ncbi:hypothetical protein MMC17_008681 [Xylographa soralifera]|nr:hypothetical protein [Xylographa soralifera]
MDEEGFLSALMVETQSLGPTTSSASPSLVTTVAESTSYVASGTFSSLSALPNATTATSNLSVSATSSSASVAVFAAISIPSVPPLTRAVVTAPADSSTLATTSAPSSLPVYTPLSNSSAYGGVLHPIVSSGAARQAPAFQWNDLEAVVELLLTLLTMV